MKCDVCKVDYPVGLCNPLMSSDGNLNKVCGICALDLSNQIHGVKRTRFDGQRAESLRKQALKFRKANNIKALEES